VGWPRCGVEVAVFDEREQPAPAGETDEIVCRGGIVMRGYWCNREATERTLAGGWLHTGDMGAFDTDGKLTLRGRSKEVIISGGSNVYPREVEEVLLQCPGVEEACVLGRKDPEWGEVVVAFIVAGARDARGEPAHGDLTEAALDRHCLEQIARFKRPKEYHFIEALPKNANGKIDKGVLERGVVAYPPLDGCSGK